jgi:hypothetical protein
MNSRRLLLLSLLLVAAYLALFGDKTPSDKSADDVVQAVPARGKGSSGASAISAGAGREPADRVEASGAGKAASTLEVAALIPRETLIPAAGDDQAVVICSPR